ncbi:gas vesicle protein GvpG [Staphylococcus agnetis]|uniref:gas vesicle protein GvpG n=1 Tax=Staphylococcus agnetis TaxID=985762 RepID=UPI00208F1055|nr:gas vesicle protein GvpG [Staphylococcus agnetis]MCO4344505.1 gas vesicle protein GvpG [Staphylococcus agnetis]MCO4354143.1 gas vesicle protein GvpG [Staphylococcus agnetis]MCO4358770.1 gas vesicle protein GvpG [Staphylococcus agnetis]MCO4363467.1 gas vesicle protein GvpG [Staphylococcus agnetis]MCO4370662.1 gas vesicle protein GvpG [Staphylococcus agnetis]
MLAYGSIKMLTSIACKVKEEADKEHLQMMAELGEIPEDVYKEQEEVLLARYEIAKQREIDKWEALIDEKEER